MAFASGAEDAGAPLAKIGEDGSVEVRSLEWMLRLIHVAPGWEPTVVGSYLCDCVFGPDHMEKGLPSVSDHDFLLDMKTSASQQILERAGWAAYEGSQVDLATITSELAILREGCGISDTDWLFSIEWENEFIDGQGRRAPPWRRSAGDLGYIRACTVEGSTITVLIHPDGVQAIKGMTTDDKGASYMNYDSAGDKYSGLHELLSHASDGYTQRLVVADYKAKVPAATSAGEEATAGANDELSKPGGAREVALFDRSMARAWRPAPAFSNFGFEPEAPTELKSTAQKTLRFDDTLRATDGGGAGGDAGAAEDEDRDEDEGDEELDEFRYTSAADYPPEHWEIHKRMKYLNSGNQTATIIALCSLRDYDLTSPACQFAIREKGLDLLINLLDTEDSRCKIAALLVLRDISLSHAIKHAIAELDGMKAMVRCLDDENEDELRSLAAATIANCATYARNRRVIRVEGGVEKLVKLLYSPSSDTGENEMARCGALALESCCRNKTIRKMILDADALPLLAQLIKSENVPLLIPVVGILVECANQDNFRSLIREAGMVPYFVKCLTLEPPAGPEDEPAADAKERKSAFTSLKASSAAAIFKCAQEAEARDIVLAHEGLAPLVTLLQQPDNPKLMEGVTGAIWKCAKNAECNAILVEAKACEFLVPLLTNQPETVLMHVVGALSELAADSTDPTLDPTLKKRRATSGVTARKAIRTAGGIDNLVKLLTGTNQDLLINVTKAVGACAADKDNMAAISRGDGVRLLWSLLKFPNAEVQAGAAWAICPCIEMAPDAGEMVRSFVGGLELIVGLLRSQHVEVLSSICAAIANIARDNENLAVITDHDVVNMLSRLAETHDDRLRCQLAKAIGQCCSYASNRVAFGQANAVAPLVRYLKSKDPLVHRATANALSQLSMDPDNCITMHNNDVVRYLIPMIGSTDVALQEAAAQCTFNIRRLALVNELEKNK